MRSSILAHAAFDTSFRRPSKTEETKILNFQRMKNLAEDKHTNGEETGKKFLLGLDARDKPTRTAGWHGTHHNINDDSSHHVEMMELIDHLRRKMKLY